MAGGAEPAGFAGESQQVLVLAVVAPDAGKAALQYPAIQELLYDLRNDGPQATVARLVLFGVAFHKLLKMSPGALPKRRLARIGALSTGRLPRQEQGAGHSMGRLREWVL